MEKNILLFTRYDHNTGIPLNKSSFIVREDKDNVHKMYNNIRLRQLNQAHLDRASKMKMKRRRSFQLTANKMGNWINSYS